MADLQTYTTLSFNEMFLPIPVTARWQRKRFSSVESIPSPSLALYGHTPPGPGETKCIAIRHVQFFGIHEPNDYSRFMVST